MRFLIQDRSYFSIFISYCFGRSSVFLVRKYFLFKFNHGHIVSWVLFQVVSFLSIYLLDFIAEKYKKWGNNRWYFFTPRDRKYPNGNRPNRRTRDGYGYWKATGGDKSIENEKGVKIGVRKALVFHVGMPGKCEKTEWIMHEYIKQDASDPPRKLDGTMQLDECVLCVIRRKRGAAVTTARSKERRTKSQVQQIPQHGGELMNIGESSGCTANYQALVPNYGRELVPPNHQVMHNIGSNDGNTNYQATPQELFAFGGQQVFYGLENFDNQNLIYSIPDKLVPPQDQVTENVGSNQVIPQELVPLTDEVIRNSIGSYDSSADYQRFILQDGRESVPLNDYNAYDQVIPHVTAELAPLIDGSNAMFIDGSPIDHNFQQSILNPWTESNYHGHQHYRPWGSEVIPLQQSSLPMALPEIELQPEANSFLGQENRVGFDDEYQFAFAEHLPVNTMNQPSHDNHGNFGDDPDSGHITAHKYYHSRL